MPTDGIATKEKIIELIKTKGPVLPVQVAKETGLSILFASAFLSDLFSERELKMSNLRIGSSPLYFISGQEPQLENFSIYLKGKEREAFLFLKEKEVLKDSDQHPAIRVALREIKDFAIPFEKQGAIFWRYFLIREPNDIPLEQVGEEDKTAKEISTTKEEIAQKEEVAESPQEQLKEDKEPVKEFKEKTNLEIKEIRKSKISKTTTKPKKSIKNDKKNENFFNKIKEFLAKKDIEILDIKDFKNDEAILKVKNKGIEEIAFFYNKKKITEKEILSCFKKASGEKLRYSIFFFGEPSKKMEESIAAMKSLTKIDKIE